MGGGSKGGGSKGGDPPTDPPPEPPTVSTGAEDAHVTVQVPATPSGSTAGAGRGDSTLAKACPSLQGLTKKTYRQMRIRLQTYRSMAKRRGEEEEADAAFLLLNQVQDYHFWAVENFDHTLLDTTNPYDAVMSLLDDAFKYTPEVEVPARCTDFFHAFFREKNETLEKYNVRHATQLRLLEGLGCTLPELLKVWHYMSRGGFQESQWPALRSLMGSDHNLENAKKAAVRMFGSESMPDGKTLEVTKRTLIMKIDGKKVEEMVWYGEEEGNYEGEEDAWWSSEWDDEAYYYDDWQSEWPADWEEAYVEEGADGDAEVPEELEKLADETDELLITWMDSRKKMNELARSRGFYPVMAVPPELAQSYGGGGAPRTASKGKGKGKGKGKSKQKGKGGKGRRPYRPAPKGFGKGTGGGFPKQTGSGSTMQHGPRFKRMRNDKPADGGSEANLVEDVLMIDEWSEDESPDIPAPVVGSASARAASAGPARESGPEPEAESTPKRRKKKGARRTKKKKKDKSDQDKSEPEAKDFWRTCGNRVIRVHMKPRRSLFCPNDCGDCPAHPDHLENRRTTERTNLEGDCVIEADDCWRASSRAHFIHVDEWQGHTTFYVRPENGLDYEWYSPGTPESIKGVIRVSEDRRNEPGVARSPLDGSYYILNPLAGEREYELEERVRAGKEAEEELRQLRANQAELNRRRAETGRRIRERARREGDRESQALVAEDEDANSDKIGAEIDEIDLIEDGKVRGVVDSGCTTTVCGKDVWKAFLKQRKEGGENGVVTYYRAYRKFRFGNGEVTTSTAKATLEVNILGARKWLEVHLVPGGTPFLLSRTCMEEWLVEISFAKKSMRIDDGHERPWIQVEVSNKGHYLLDLIGEGMAEEAMAIKQESESEERETSDEEAMQESSEEEEWMDTTEDKKLELETAYAITIEEKEPYGQGEVASAEVVKKVIEAVWPIHEASKEELRRIMKEKQRPRIIFEIFVDEGRVSNECCKYAHVQVFQFSIQNGWDFRRTATRNEMMRWVRWLKPDDVLLAPPCGPWCQWQKVNMAWIPGYKEKLEKVRKESRKCFLEMTRDIWKEQVKGRRHCHIEQPWTAESWNTPELRILEGHVADCCQCSFGAKAYGPNGEILGPCKKRTKILTTREEMATRLTRTCNCLEDHVAVRGKHAKRLQNYPEEMVREIAGVMSMSEDEIADACCCHEDERIPKTMAEEMMVCMVEAVVPEDDQEDEATKEHLKEMRRKYGAETVRTVLKLHRMLGHPPTAALAAHLRHAGAEAEWIQCAKELKCQHCKERERPRAVRVSRIPRADHFNELVEMDTFYVMHKGEMRKVLTIQDVYSRFSVDVPVKKETAGCELRALEQHWCSWAGAPKELRIDSSGAHMSEKFKKGCEVSNIQLRIIPHGSHHQLGALERDHQVRSPKSRSLVILLFEAVY